MFDITVTKKEKLIHFMVISRRPVSETVAAEISFFATAPRQIEEDNKTRLPLVKGYYSVCEENSYSGETSRYSTSWYVIKEY